jgi:hypothetical protein
MDTGFRGVLLASVRLLLKPIVHLLLKGGVPFREFSELAKFAYVEIATKEFGIRGRPTNVSRTAILTGLNRRDVARIRAAAPQAVLPAGFMSPGSRVLSGWHQDPIYLAVDREPLRLPIDGEAPSFQSLVRQYARDLPHIALFKELSSAGAVDVGTDGLVRALMRSYIPNSYDPNQIRLWGSVLHDVGETLAHNVIRPAIVTPRFERRAINLKVRRADVAAFRLFLEAEGQVFLERIDDWLTRHSAGADDSADNTDTVRLGAGVYHIEESVTRSSRS